MNKNKTLEDFSIEEFATLVGRHPETMRRAARSGRLPFAYKLAGTWMINREKFEAMRQGQAVTHDAR